MTLAVKVERPAGGTDITGFVGDSACAKKEADWMMKLLPQGGMFIEVGTYNGATAAYMSLKRPDATILCVDSFPKERMDMQHNTVGNIVHWMLNKLSNMDLFVGTLQELTKITSPRFADLVFIDGDHRYDFVSRDLVSALHVGKGYILVHDYQRENLEDIKHAVDDFCKKHAWAVVKKVWTTVLLRPISEVRREP